MSVRASLKKWRDRYKDPSAVVAERYREDAAKRRARNVTRSTPIEIDGRTYELTPHGSKGTVRVYERRKDGSVRRVPRTVGESVVREVYLRMFDRERPL